MEVTEARLLSQPDKQQAATGGGQLSLWAAYSVISPRFHPDFTRTSPGFPQLSHQIIPRWRKPYELRQSADSEIASERNRKRCDYVIKKLENSTICTRILSRSVGGPGGWAARFLMSRLSFQVKSAMCRPNGWRLRHTHAQTQPQQGTAARATGAPPEWLSLQQGQQPEIESYPSNATNNNTILVILIIVLLMLSIRRCHLNPIDPLHPRSCLWLWTSDTISINLSIHSSILQLIHIQLSIDLSIIHSQLLSIPFPLLPSLNQLIHSS